MCDQRPAIGNRRRRGSALFEAALVLWFMVMLTFGLVELGHYLFVVHNMKGAARSGARVAIVPGATIAEVQEAVRDTMTAAGYGEGKYTCGVDPDPQLAGAGDHITVSVRCRWSDVGVRPLRLLPANAQLQAAAVMRAERQ